MHKVLIKAIDFLAALPTNLQANPLGAACIVLMTFFICTAVAVVHLGK